MNEPHFNELMEKLDKIIDLLESMDNWLDEIAGK